MAGGVDKSQGAEIILSRVLWCGGRMLSQDRYQIPRVHTLCAALGATRARTPAHRPSGPLNRGGKGGGGTGTEDPPGGPTAATAAGLPVGAGSAPCCVLRGHLRTALGHAGPLGVGHQNVLTNEEAGPHARHGPGVGAGIPPPS